VALKIRIQKICGEYKKILADSVLTANCSCNIEIQRIYYQNPIYKHQKKLKKFFIHTKNKKS
jgi:hypothetical protein